MFEWLDMELKESVVKSIVDIAKEMKFKKPNTVFPVLQLIFRKMGKEEIAPKSMQHISRTVTPIEAEALVYLFNSEDEYFFLSVAFKSEEIITDGKELGKYNEDMLKCILPDIPMVSIAYGNANCSVDFTTANIKKLFLNPLDSQDEFGMDYSTQLRRKDINDFVKNFIV